MAASPDLDLVFAQGMTFIAATVTLVPFLISHLPQQALQRHSHQLGAIGVTALCLAIDLLDELFIHENLYSFHVGIICGGNPTCKITDRRG